MMSENGKTGGKRFHDNHSERTQLNDLKFKRLLSDNPGSKTAVVEAEVTGSSDPAVVVINKLPFTEEDLNGILSSTTKVENEMQNDIYGQYWLKPDPLYNPVKVNIIHPATQKHIEKYINSPSHLVNESSDLYLSVTLPCIQQEQFSLDWVYNILEKKKEQDRIIYENPDPIDGFLMAPDFKWTGKQIEDLYVLGIVHKKGIKSLRDLNRSHLPLLYNLRDQGKQAIQKKYGLPIDKIRAYFHYQPSYYHLHVHFTALQYDAPGINCEKSHMLEDVISNIEMDGSYYQTALLSFAVNEKSKLFMAYKEVGYFQNNESKKNFLEQEFETGSCEKVLQFLEMIGKAKHEPSGEQWESSYGESAWRMAILSLSLPHSVDRLRLVNLALVSSLCSLGSCNDENTEWESKCTQVKQILSSHLPTLAANKLFSLFQEHVEIRRGRLNGSLEHTLYRGILELEEVLLRWEEEGKGKGEDFCTEAIFNRMAKLQFPGAHRFTYYKEKDELQKFLKFLLKISELMRLKRTGWVKCQVRDPETVAAHMFRMGVMGIIFSHQSQSINWDQSLGFRCDSSIISICHDMAECIIGDITPHCKVSPEDKAQKELLAFQDLTRDLPESVALDLLVPFSRYENQEADDLNAILTKDFDKFDMILQAFEYEKKEKRGPFLQQFFDSTMTCFKTQAVKKWQKTLLEVRTQYFSTQ